MAGGGKWLKDQPPILQYTMDRKEKKQEQNQKYWEKHRDQFLEKKKIYRQIKVMCSCGKEISRNRFSEHVQTKNHHHLIEKDKPDRKELQKRKQTLTSPN